MHAANLRVFDGCPARGDEQGSGGVAYGVVQCDCARPGAGDLPRQSTDCGDAVGEADSFPTLVAPAMAW
jgi:hypothetical protein